MLPVSICLTTFNRAAVLPATVESVLNQTFGEFELIISDDCSTDNTEQICREYEATDPRVRYFKNPTNLKMPGNLNAAIERARGVYVANLHDGDIYRPDLIAKWKNALDGDLEAPFVFNAYDSRLPDGSHELHREPFESKVPGVYIATIYLRSLACCVWGTVMARRAAYTEGGLFDPKYGFISDVDMWLRLARGRHVAYVPEPLITVTPRESDHPFASYSWQHLFWQFGIYNRHIENYRQLIPDQAAQFSQDYASRLRGVLMRAMLTLVRYRKWDRVREGLGIWRDSPDPILRAVGRTTGRESWQPQWYDPAWWTMAHSIPSSATPEKALAES